jgi:hypothetical protein
MDLSYIGCMAISSIPNNLERKIYETQQELPFWCAVRIYLCVLFKGAEVYEDTKPNPAVILFKTTRNLYFFASVT